MTPTRGQTLLAGALLIGIHLAALVGLARNLPWTCDETTYLQAGRAILADLRWQTRMERYQGPLPLLANQLLAVPAAEEGKDPAGERLAARAGMLPFSLLLLLAVWGWAWEAWGRGGGLLALALAALGPNLLGYGPLLAVDLSLAALAALTFWLHWRWLRRPGPFRLAAWAAALGLMLATKYLALLLALALPLLTLLAAARGARLAPRVRPPQLPAGPTRRLGEALLALLAAAPLSLLTRHAAYLFQAPLFDPAQVPPLASPLIGGLADLPGTGWLLRLLPEPLVLGADYQQAVSADYTGKFLDYDGTHWAYYPAALLAKTSPPAQLFFLLALLVPAPGRRCPPFLAAGLALPALLLFLFLVLASRIQTGFRYLLPLVPLLAVAAGAWAHKLPARPRLHRGVTALLLAWAAGTALLTWPHYLAYFNPLAGGQAGAFRLFSDSNCDWWQNYARGKEVLAARHRDLEFLGPGSGPRFGRVAAYVQHLKPPDPERPGRTYHWLTRFAPCDHYAAAWYVFEVTAEDFRQAVKNDDRRAARDLAVAHLGAGDFEQAREALALGPGGQGDRPVREALAALEQLEESDDPPARAAAARALAQVGRLDRALSLDPAAGAGDRAMLLYLAGRRDQALATLAAREKAGPLTTREALYLAHLLYEMGCPRDALDALLRNQPQSATPLAASWREMVEKVKETLEQWEQ